MRPFPICLFLALLLIPTEGVQNDSPRRLKKKKGKGKNSAKGSSIASDDSKVSRIRSSKSNSAKGSSIESKDSKVSSSKGGSIESKDSKVSSSKGGSIESKDSKGSSSKGGSIENKDSKGSSSKGGSIESKDSKASSSKGGSIESKDSKASSKGSSRESSGNKSSNNNKSAPNPTPDPVAPMPAPVPKPSTPAPVASTSAPISTSRTPEDALARSLPLREALLEENLISHLQALQDIADDNDGNRATATNGYAASVSYVASKLEAAGYTVSIQEFATDVFFDIGNSIMNEISPDDESVVKSFVYQRDFDVFTYAPSGEASGFVQNVDNLGCEAADFETFQAGNIAIIERGNCTFTVKATSAETAGAIGVIVYNNEETEEAFSGALDELGDVTVPAFSVSRAVGLEVIGRNLFLSANVLAVEDAKTQNIIADTEFGNADQTVVIGAHLDSFINTPGINDNGSAVAVALEIALQIADNGFQSKNRIRFAFWGAEELGLVGSEAYLTDVFLSQGPEAVSQMKLYLNLEILASANFVRAIYPPMSISQDSMDVEAQVAQTFQEFFDAEGITAIVLPDLYIPALQTRSDHANFQSDLVNIPSSGVITGADIPKPPEFAALFGGEAGEWTAPCYHSPCDDVENARTDVMHELGDGYAHALWTYANMDEIQANTNRRHLKEMTLGKARVDMNSRFYQGESL